MPKFCDYLVFLLLLPLSLHVEAHESNVCATTIVDLKAAVGDPSFALKWEETSMKDGKPLVVSILERNGSLVLEFVKTNEGLWLESSGVVCKTSGGLEARFDANQIRLGPAAHWVLRYAMGNGGLFKLTRLGTNQLEITTKGWQGIFSPLPTH